MAADNVTMLVGGAAAICTTLSFVPQLVKIRRQGGRDLSDGMLGLYLLGLTLWLAYGVRIRAAEVIAANVVAGSARDCRDRHEAPLRDSGGCRANDARGRPHERWPIRTAGRRCSTREGAAARQRASMGTHDRASDALSSDRLQSHGVGRARRGRAEGQGSTRLREVGEPVYAHALAGRASHEPGARSRRRGDAAERLCSRRGGSRGDRGAADVARWPRRLAVASGLRRDVRGRLVPLGLSAHGPPPAPVRIGNRADAVPFTNARARSGSGAGRRAG